jgi:hypothetical protein
MSAELPSKYVMLEDPHMPGLPLPVILPQCVQHEVAKALGRPLSAGFCRRIYSAPYVETFGESTSLNLKPRPEDARWIARWHAELFGAPAEAVLPGTRE